MDTIKLLLADNGEPRGLLIHDIEFTLTDIFECPPLHTLFHGVIKRERNTESDSEEAV